MSRHAIRFRIEGAKLAVLAGAAALVVASTTCTYAPSIKHPQPGTSVANFPTRGCWRLSGGLGQTLLLDTLPIDRPEGRLSFRVLALEPQAIQLFDFWVPADDGRSVVVFLANGHTTHQVHLEAVNDSVFEGRAYVTCDTPGCRYTIDSIVGRRVPCPEQPASLPSNKRMDLASTYVSKE
ncbi:MAG: hypothetical protein GTO22_01590 [Gemmatimonadales bacterium]|nr:hypothetical protein [Gemmatimonadales bacterium]